MAYGVAEPCSPIRKHGGALFERSEFTPSPVLAKAEGVGKPCREPKGHDRDKFCMVRLEERNRCWVLLPKQKALDKLSRGISFNAFRSINIFPDTPTY